MSDRVAAIVAELERQLQMWEGLPDGEEVAPCWEQTVNGGWRITIQIAGDTIHTEADLQWWEIPERLEGLIKKFRLRLINS